MGRVTTQAFDEISRLILPNSVVGNLCISFLDPKTGELESLFYEFPARLEAALDAVKRNADDYHAYFSPVLYSSDRRIKPNVVDQVACLWADLDECHPQKCSPEPTIAVETSPGRYQGYWLLEKPISAEEAERLNRTIAYAYQPDGCDVSGWSSNKLLRVPGTPNLKAHYAPKPVVTVISQNNKLYRPSDFARLPEPPKLYRRGDKTLPPQEDVAEKFAGRVSGFVNNLNERINNGHFVKGHPQKKPDKSFSGARFNLLTSFLEIGLPVSMMEAATSGCIAFDRGRNFTYDLNAALAKHDHVDLTCVDGNCLNPRYEPILSRQTTTKPSRLIRRKASEYTIRPVHWCWEDRIPVGEITLEVGREGAGKSIFTAWLVAQLTNGTLPGRYFGQKRVVWYVASEDSWEATIAPRLLAAGADMDLVEHIAVATDDGDETKITVPRDCALIGEEAIKAGAVMVVFDPLLSVIDGEISTNQTRELRDALEPLRKHAEKARMSVLALMHFNKMQTGDVLTKIAGARGFAEVARAALAIAVDHEAEDYTVVLSQAKNNLGRLDLPNLAYTIEGFEIQTDEGIARPGKLRWVSDEYEANAETILNREVKTKTSKQTAKDWLYNYLKEQTHGKQPVDKNEVIAAAELAGYSPKTMNNAMTNLKEKYAQTEERGFGADKTTLWGLKTAAWFTIVRKEGE